MKLWLFVMITVFVNLINGSKSMGQYQFLGNVTEMVQEQRGILLTCGSDQVRVQVLTSGLVRITLARAGHWDAGPDYAIHKTDWPQVPFSISEESATIHLKTAALEIRIQRAPGRFSFFDPAGQLLNQDDPAFGMALDGNEVACFKKLLPDEQFFGLGEKTGALNRRGSEWIMWNSDIPAYSDRTDPLYQSHPFFIGWREGRAHGIFFNNSYRSAFSLGAGNHRLYSFRAEGGALDYFFFAGPTLKDVITRYSELVGRMPLPPMWSLGYQQCRWSYFPEHEVRTLAQTFRDKKIPADVIYLDIHHMDDYRCFTFDSERFPNPGAMLGDLAQQGFKVIPIIDPGIKVDPGYWVYESGLAGDHFIKFPDGERYIGDVWPGPSHFADYTRPETRQWWGDLHRNFLDLGIAGFWNDMNEPAVWGKEAPLLVEFDENGKKVSIKKIHNVFGHLMAQATYEGLLRLRPDTRPFILTRAGFAGTQRYSASWTGDNVASFEHLEVAIRMCLSMGLSAIPFVGADVGGFADSPSTELFVRWLQVGAFTPFLRNHTHVNTRDQEPWSFGEETEAIARKYIELRYQMLPYTYTAFYQAAQTGLPIMRPLFLDYPDEPETFAGPNVTTYLWGEDILVAPVTREGERLRKVYLPKGQWYDFWDNRTFDGGKYIYLDAPLDKLPLFVRAGAVIPMRAVQQWIGEKPLTELVLHVYPGPERTSMLYEDDGRSFAYQHGEQLLTQFKMSQGKKTTSSLTIAARQGSFVPPARQYRIVIHGDNPESVRLKLDGVKLDLKNSNFHQESGLVAFSWPDDGKKHVIEW